jgi:energy-coupling factor transporter ATP-binding protein EcfA2
LLIRFRVENFRSIHAEQELSLVASSLSERPETLVHADRYDFDLLRGAAIYGPNASGKSTLVAALAFMKTAVEDSQRVWAPNAGIPRTPFALDPDAAKEPSMFVVDLLLDGIRYEYGFVVDSQQVLEEWLYAYPKGRKQEWFTRDASREQEFAFSRHMPGENRTISGFTRPNSLFLSAGAQNNHTMLHPVFRWFSSNVLVFDEQWRSGGELAVVQLCLDETRRSSVQHLLEAADVGITNVEILEEDASSFAKRLRVPPDAPFLKESPFAPRYGAGVQLRHRSGLDGESVVLPFSQESEGTKAMFSLAGIINVILSQGGLLLVDELDRSLHSQLASMIVSLFNDPETNPQNAQLIFNTHDTNLLDTRILRRDQIWFTEKDEKGATHLYPLTDFRARKHENLERGYLQGRYGAVPAVGGVDLAPVVED